MRLLQFFIQALVNSYSFSANPNLFGSKNRMKSMNKVAEGFNTQAGETQSEIDALQSQNPFETAAAKAAMAKASRTSKQMLTRNLNVMGANATPEALIASQGALNEGVGAAAGEIASGAEANQKNEVANLRGLKANQLGASGQARMGAAQQYGSGWSTLFQGIDSLGNILSGVGAAGGVKGIGKTITG